MDVDIAKEGYIKISKLEDRATIAEILYRNGYSIVPAKKKSSRSFEYFLHYRLDEEIIPEDTKA